MRLVRSAGGVGVTTNTLGKMCHGRPRPRTLPSPPQPGYARRLGRSETELSHYRTRGPERGFKLSDSTSVNAGAVPRSTEPESRQHSYFSAFSIAASAIGAMILNPAAFGCSPSSARSFFMSPLSSTMALK